MFLSFASETAQDRRHTAPFGLLALAAAQEALENARWQPKLQLDCERTVSSQISGRLIVAKMYRVFALALVSELLTICTIQPCHLRKAPPAMSDRKCLHSLCLVSWPTWALEPSP